MTTRAGKYDPAKRTDADKARAKAYYRTYMPARRRINKEFLESIRAEGKCVDCGIADPRVLQFHHRDGNDTKYAVAMFANWSIRRLKEEINKCDLLCANCHIIRHHQEQTGYFAQKGTL